MVDLTIYKEYEMVITELKNRAGSNSVLDEIIVKAINDFNYLNQFVSYIKFNTETGSQELYDHYKAELKDVPDQLLTMSASLMGATIDRYIQHNSVVEVPATRG